MSKDTKTKVNDDKDGGYYAIKGFLFQFDKTLIEVMNNPDKTIAFENQQDINYENYVLQIKHKETQCYSPSKIRKAVETLLGLFAKDQKKTLCLYCFFKDKHPQDWKLKSSELDAVISAEARASFPGVVRSKFLAHFIVRFSEDYESQFQQTIALIKSKFSLGQDDEAVLYHSIFRSKLLGKCCLPNKESRIVNLKELKKFLEEAEVTIFHAAYEKYLSAEKYVKLIKKRYFTFTAVNLENFERLFLVECEPSVNQTDLMKICSCISRKYWRKGKSPQPYVIFRNLAENALRDLKRALFDDGIRFFDGTYFDGDRFREDDFVCNDLNEEKFKLKVGLETNISLLLKRVNVREVFQFFVEQPAQLSTTGSHFCIQIGKAEEVINMIR